ncbi:DUF2280 domain-containing protein [Ensifer adhaerens]|uniref:DUF2280 domain-containing protein n=1 Tax=Ensifer adhaerens TaxID=106592 RepID=A0ABY8HC00_ENSAD|nr:MULTISPECIES: DUF2280 domain-containing protein [Ensifer]WFP88994.1 DUF2280 domain-containing protein [Ensifer adhaerens]
MAKPKLSDEVKTYIVKALACFDSPPVVAAAPLAALRPALGRI